MTPEAIEKAVDAFLRDDIAAFENDPELEAVAVEIVKTFAQSNRGQSRQAAVDASKTDAVLDIIMERSCPTDSLEMSLSRLSAAVGALGFKKITRFAAYAAYNAFPQLSQPLKKALANGKRT